MPTDYFEDFEGEVRWYVIANTDSFLSNIKLSEKQRRWIYVNSGSSNNKIYDNTIMNFKSQATLIKNASSANAFYTNK